ncbi:hypothetical protein [Paenibacillus hexagrammi]|uniref:Uncharacterized protein n=1 Tax=Paenibacillus hexagrammi TaxID=2908839 RepID=A0ABY3STK7_9BACL|nr:hypothetical protein [Paenibacillus sp. YPD9-1]UJF36579.1 hypothetical protein L0M14_30795 [Paenibacillus sp. YPD9-1]
MELFMYTHPWLFFSMFGIAAITLTMMNSEIASTIRSIKIAKENKELAIAKVMAESALELEELKHDIA